MGREYAKQMSSLLPSYTHIVNPRLKHVYLKLDAKGNLIIKSPKIKPEQLERILLKKADWINRSKNKLQHKKGKPLEFNGKDMLYFLGKAYDIELIFHSMKKTVFVFEKDRFTLYYHRHDPVLFQKHIDRFYAQKAQELLPTLINKWSQRMELYPSALKFQKTKRQWGSCSGKNILSFNTMAMKLPLEVIEYIIVHELSHIQHKHHQKAFWDCVASYIPNYKTHIAELKTYH